MTESVDARESDMEDSYDLSPLQEGMLFHTLRDTAVGMYISQAMSPVENLDVDALKRAWQRLLDRHTTLRTSFDWSNPGHPKQIVHKDVEVDFTVHDWRSFAPGEQRAKLTQLLDAERERGFDLRVAPLVRVTVSLMSRARSQVINTHHHILLDGWSGGIISGEVWKLYQAERLGQSLQLDPPKPFRRYIDWLSAQDLGKVERFWRRQLVEITGPTPLPEDRQRHSKPQGRIRVGAWAIKLERATCTRLRSLAKQFRVTLSTLIQGAWGILLSRHSQRETVLFGVLVSGRPPSLDGVESIVGMFLNTVPFRVTVQPQQRLADWLQDLREQQVELQDYEHSPLMLVQQWCEIPRGVPLFDSIVARKDTTGGQSQKRGSRSRSSKRDRAQTTFQQNYPLLLNIMAREGIELKMTYDVRRFESADVVRIMDQLSRILLGMIEEPSRRLGSLSLMSNEERTRLVTDWNQTQVAEAEGPALHRLFEQQVERTPNVLAVIDRQQRITYRQFDRAANRLAHYLRNLGVASGSVVGLALERSLEWTIAMLAVLKAGAAYVPLDLDTSGASLEPIVDDAGMTLVITRESFLDRMPHTLDRILCIDRDGNQWAEASSEPLDLTTNPEDLAYILYGADQQESPVGVAVPHRVPVNRLLTDPDPVQPGESLCAMAPVGSVAAAWETFLALANGATLTIVSSPEHQAPARWIKTLTLAEVTRIVTTPTLLLRLLDSDGDLESRLPHLRHVISTGNPLASDVCRRFASRLPQAVLVNTYGTREIGDGTRADSRDRPPGEPVPIGRPIGNVRSYVLDSGLESCPIGIAGELHIAGSGLALGYWRRPELTAERFVNNPFDAAGGRLFKTGDLARWLPDGNLECLGRLDEPCVIRGSRIMPHEIEAVLRQHPTVKQVAIVANASQQLVAYIVTDGASVENQELRQFAGDRLPEPLIPISFTSLDELPLRANGTLDRGVLAVRAIEETRALEAARRSRAPETEMERRVAAVWAEVLGLETISADDNFFELGGHSLKATRVMGRLSQGLEVEIPLRGIFEAPTVSGLAAWIESNRDGTGSNAPPPVVAAGPVDGVREAPQSFAQQRLWFLVQLASGSALYNTPGAIQLTGELNAEAVERALTELFRRHESLRTTFAVSNGEPVQIISPSLPVNLTVVDLRPLRGQQRVNKLQQLRRNLTGQPFDLARGPLVRFRLVRMKEDRQILLFCMHHIITDGWSLGVLRREFSELYEAFRANRPSPLPEPTLQYADYAIWQREWLQGEVVEKQLDYWKEKLRDASRLKLPTDCPRSAARRYASASCPIEIDEEITSKLHQLARRQESTLFMVLLAAFQYLLGQYGCEDDVVVGTPIANRSRPEFEALMGFFVNTLAIRTDLSGSPSFLELLGQVRQTCLDAFAHQDLPFEKVVEELAPERDLTVQPLFQVLFVLQNTPQAQQKPGRQPSRAGRSDNPEVAGQIFFDLTLSLRETGSTVAGALHFNSDLFDRTKIARLSKQLLTLLTSVTQDPARPLVPSAMISQQERHQLLVAFHGDAVPMPDLCAHQLFEASVDRFPARPAILSDDVTLTYRDLDHQANQVAGRLLRLGLAEESTVAVYLERGPQAIVALLGILKAGGVYLPMDTALPPERLNLILTDAQPAAILTTRSLVLGLPEFPAATIYLDEPGDEEATERPPITVSPSQLAYIIFTSGSTGRPKGAMVEHRSLCNTILGQIPIFGVTPRSRVLSTIALSFDASLGEIFRTLAAGATLCLARRDDLLPGPAFMELLRRWQITFVTLVPAVLGVLPKDVELPELETVTVGGEALSAELAEHWSRGRRLVNGYGPTETAIGATAASGWEPGRKPPLGRPLPNVKAYVLDENQQLIPAGVPGELYLGGPGLARGYLNRPELTGEVFLDNPFEAPGARLYRTGDRVRWLDDGQLEFLGRIDDQVKIRGYRIEPGEIAAVLCRHPDLAEAVVLPRYDGSTQARLVGYVVPARGSAAPTDAAEQLVDEWQKAAEVAADDVKVQQSPDPRLNFSGWTNSYDGQPIPIDEMQAWADSTVERIVSLNPRETLEIGSGTGLMLFRVAPHCRRYVGVDFAAGLLDQTRSHLDLLEGSGCEVELLQRRANALHDLPDCSFDCVVLNSVVQYFPDASYLVDVLQQAVRLVRGGGTIFIGDVRNLRLLDALHASIQLSRAPATSPTSGLVQRVERHRALERELVIDPGLFIKMCDSWPRLSHLQILPKAGSAGNELTTFRCDVVLHVDGPAAADPGCEWLSWCWDSAAEGLEAVREVLAQGNDRLGLRGIPNARTEAHTRILPLLQQPDAPQTILDLRQHLAALPPAVEPEGLIALAAELGYTTELSWLGCNSAGSFDALFRRDGDETRLTFGDFTAAALPWSEFANDPAQAAQRKNLRVEIRDHLEAHLPEYMIPSALVVLDELPLTANGKIDHQALPDPLAHGVQSASDVNYVAPRTEAEKSLADIWSALLRVSQVGIHDNFFDLGGDSILSIQMIARAKQAGIELSPKHVYQYQTIAEQAALVAGSAAAVPHGADSSDEAPAPGRSREV